MKITQLRNQAYEEAIILLEQHQKAVIVRPTGFGKTGILTRFLSDYIPQHQLSALYLYPSDIIRQSALRFYYGDDAHQESDIPNTTFMTYSALVRMDDEKLEKLAQSVDLIICDECHKLGAPKTLIAMNTLTENMKDDAMLLGATATPERMDLVDEISLLFDNHVISRYTLHDAFEDGILTRPYYCFCSYGNTDIADIERATRLNIDGDLADRQNAESLLRSRLIEISHLSRMDKIIRETCDQYAPDNKYMKFITFFSSFAHIHDQSDQVTEWFQNAYPNYQVRTIIISSENQEYTENLDALPTFTHRENTIDLILCCDMLNMGYHVDDLTGVVMYRGTQSGIIFAQQLGRALSTGHNNAGIIFDVVDNIHREAMYDVLGQESTWTSKRRDRYTQLEAKDATTPDKMTPQETQELKSLRLAFDQPDKWWLHANDLQPKDLIATGHEATYRELIAKTVAEPISMRCRQAWQAYVEAGGDTGLTRNEYMKAATEFKKNSKVDKTPLPPYCWMKSVSIQAVLDEMGIK